MSGRFSPLTTPFLLCDLSLHVVLRSFFSDSRIALTAPLHISDFSFSIVLIAHALRSAHMLCTDDVYRKTFLSNCVCYLI